ncbi:unnamed protein product [Ilex paraguariensis]|uniref:Uncharacterized protein n=1 Tax=Ilex paraguariensis TaxID=185542 RepID=A0ABC8U446_9AQUA
MMWLVQEVEKGCLNMVNTGSLFAGSVESDSSSYGDSYYYQSGSKPKLNQEDVVYDVGKIVNIEDTAKADNVKILNTSSVKR